MPTRDDGDALSADDARAVIADVCFPERPDERSPGRVGVELERLPVVIGDEGRPFGRVPIEGGSRSSTGVLDALAGEVNDLGAMEEVGGIPAYRLARGGRLTFEPGGVIEHATAVHDTAAAALEEIDELGPPVTEAFDERGVSLASVGVDPWHDVATVPVQLRCFRYPAMAAYFAKRGPDGRIIMRHSSSIQVNLDLGFPGERADRWLLANLVAPLLTATFANSPTGASVAERALAWQDVDPTRTGFPSGLVDGSTPDPVEQLTRAALEADVMLIRTGADTAVSGAPGWTFGAWLADGHPDWGRPTRDDLSYHLSTLFHEVRPRGMLEFRSVDAVPYDWRAVPIVLLAGALEDAGARDRLLGLLAPRLSELPALWHRAARSGVADPSFCALAVEAWSYALEGAARLPAGYLPSGGLVRVEEFLERFTLRGRCPADELREALASDPADALAWAAEPVPERAKDRR